MKLKSIIKVLKSRGLFKNWFSAGLKYFLWRRDLLKEDAISIICRDGAKGDIPIGLFGPIINAYFHGVIKEFSCIKKSVVTWYDSEIPLEELLAGSAWVYALRFGWRYNNVNGYWFKGNVKFKHMYEPILEVFEYGEYEKLNVNGKIVIDVGAFIGDSAIYFAIKGAERVIAIEPIPINYLEMLENIKLNSLDIKKIMPINAALGSERGNLRIKIIEPHMYSLRNSPLDELRTWNSNDTYVYVPKITLMDIINEFNIDTSRSVLKMDCEGCEFDIILKDYDHVKLFDEIYFEHHTYLTGTSINRLLKLLEKDYKCDIVSTENFYKRHGLGVEHLGLIYCKKQT